MTASVSMRPAVFLDRDGVLNEPVVVDGRPHPPESAEDVVLSNGAVEACGKLHGAGLLLIVVTNQPDVARGTQTLQAVDAINASLRAQLPIDDLVMCPHDDNDGCQCRKPAPGMLLSAAARWRIDLARSVMVGDRWRDVEAGRNAGCRTVFIDRGYKEASVSHADLIAASLKEATPWIMKTLDTDSPTATRQAGASAADLKVKVFADGADERGMIELAGNPLIRGFTTNPTLMRAAGITDYRAFAHRMLARLPGMPISFEVFADDFAEMERQAHEIASWGDDVYVKIPITTTTGASCATLAKKLAADGIKLNVTAIFTLEQVDSIIPSLAGGPSSFISIFAGRIADAGIDPLPTMEAAIEMIRPHPNIELIWASPREILNVVQADAIGCHVITVTHDLLKKLPSLGRNLNDFSLDTVKMFYRDAQASGFRL